jgi:hypothetical protein
MNFKQIAAAVEAATKTIVVKVKSSDYYARAGDLDDEYIQIIDPERFIEELKALDRLAAPEAGAGDQQ